MRKRKGRALRRRYGHGFRPAGGDARFDYVPFHSLSQADQARARGRYPHKMSHLPDEEYLYPVKQDGSLASARRYMDNARAAELYAKWGAS